MAENFDASHQQSLLDSEPNLSELKKEVEITPSTLKDITSKEQFIERVVELSSKAKESINMERAKQALVYLTEAQKILQYAASRGKNIDKYIIVSVLHNEACCYQKIWELEKCSQYLEALIFNFNSFLHPDAHHPDAHHPNVHHHPDRQHSKFKSYEESASEAIDRKTSLAKYYLQFCAVNSQTDNHSGALVAARKSIQILKSVFRELSQATQSMKKAIYQKKSQFDYKVKLIVLASRVNDSIQIKNYDRTLQAARHYLRLWKESKDSKERPERNYILEEQFKNFSIGNAMQIVPLSYKDLQELKGYSAKCILQKVLLMALGYFTISTELRLIAGKKYSKCDSEKVSSVQYKQSEIYHLLSIIIAAACVPFEVLYIKHVLSSYANHYRTDLLPDHRSRESGSDFSFEEFVFPQGGEPTCRITAGDSFVASEHEQTVSKFEKDQTEDVLGEAQTNRKKLQLSKEYEDQTTKNFMGRDDLARRVKAKNKSKSKSKSIKSIKLLGLGQKAQRLGQKAQRLGQKSQKSSPMPKSPGVHLKSPGAHLKSPGSNLIKVKTSFKLKVSAEKIITTNNFLKQDKSKKKRDTRAENIEFDYFMGKSKDVKKIKKAVEAGLNLPSPRPPPSSKSSSKRESPFRKYFDQLKPHSPAIKTVKSPKKGSSKHVKNNIQQYYL